MNSQPDSPVTPPSEPERESGRPPRFPFSILLLVWLLSAVVAALVSFLMPETYCSTAFIAVDHSRREVSGIGDSLRRTEFAPDFVQVQVELIQSEVVLGRAIANLDLGNVWGKKYAGGERLKTSEALGVFKNRLDVRSVHNTRLLAIRVFSEQAEEAAKVANAVAEAYRDYRQTLRMERIKESILVLEEASRDNNAKIRKARAELDALLRGQPTEDTNRLEEAQTVLDGLRRFGENLIVTLEAEKTNLRLPATGMAETIERAEPQMKPVRPNRPLNIFVGFVAGGFGGVLLSTLVYLLQYRAYRLQSGLAGTRFPLWFRTILHVLVALVVGLVVGYHCGEPLTPSTAIAVPLTLLLGIAASAYIELTRPVGMPEPEAASVQRGGAQW